MQEIDMINSIFMINLAGISKGGNRNNVGVYLVCALL